MKKDIQYILLFTAIGLVVAYFASAPMRKPVTEQPMVGTPLNQSQNSSSGGSYASEDKIYAEGHINLGDGLDNAAASGRVLFLIAKVPAGGPPIAVKKISVLSFPFEFSLSQENNMVGTDFYEGDIVITARLDKDGAAGPKQPDDWEGSAEIKAGGNRHVDIEIKK
jgi:hypothetical protein